MPAAQENDAIVSYDAISKSYDGRTYAIRGFDLDIKPGEFLTMLGPSGSGKTTLLMMLAGFETPTSGRIIVRGRPIQDTPPYKRNIGVVFQSYALFPHMTVAENVAYPLKVRRIPKVQMAERVKRALEMVQLDPYRDRRTTQLSGGQQQRVALARALVFDPELILMDEPLGALDKMLREEMQYEIKKLHTKVGVTVVYVTHDQSEAMVMSDRVAILRDGALRQVAPPRELYEQPADAFVASFIGENNRLNGKVESLSSDICSIMVPGCGRVVCRSGDLDREGGEATVTIRPERIHINRVQDPDARENSLQATVTDVTYLGDSFRLELRLASGVSLLAKSPNTARFETFSANETVEVSWSRAEAIAFKPEAVA